MLRINCLYAIIWCIILSFLFFQFALSKYSVISNLALVTLFLLQIKENSILNKRMLLAGLWVLLMSSYSVILQNELSLIFRFSLILFFILGAYFIKLEYKVVLKYLFVISFALCIFLILFELILQFQNTQTLKVIRHFFVNKNIGDIYTTNGYFFKIQLKGTALLPFVYLLSFFVPLFPPKKNLFFKVLYLISIIIAGNFAYLLCLFIFHIYYYFYKAKSQKSLLAKTIIIISFLVAVSGILSEYLMTTLEQKSVESNAIRIEQSQVLLGDVNKNIYSIFLGQGLGHTVDVVASFRDYSNATYYELQALYFYNQLGLVGFLIFVSFNFYFTLCYIRSCELKLLYLLYIMYAVTNPYILDTNQVVVIISLICTQQFYNQKKEDEKNNLRISFI